MDTSSMTPHREYSAIAARNRFWETVISGSKRALFSPHINALRFSEANFDAYARALLYNYFFV
jgi:hypothetical protein